MLTIEEYIARRKKEDYLDEFDTDARNDNMKICVNYVFEYFNNYLNITPAEERTALKNEKVEKYRKIVSIYDKEVEDWLVEIYSEYGKDLTLSIRTFVRKDDFFYLYNTENEFRTFSYDYYACLVKTYPFIKNYPEMIFLFLKEYHRIKTDSDLSPSFHYDKNADCNEIVDWVDLTLKKYHVNILQFVESWIYKFGKSEKLWPTTHRIKSESPYGKYYYDYDYKQNRNLFNLDSLYRRMPKKPFTRGKKQYFEILMMDDWLHSIEGDEDYWKEYLEKTLSSLRKS